MQWIKKSVTYTYWHDYLLFNAWVKQRHQCICVSLFQSTSIIGFHDWTPYGIRVKWYFPTITLYNCWFAFQSAQLLHEWCQSLKFNQGISILKIIFFAVLTNPMEGLAGVIQQKNAAQPNFHRKPICPYKGKSMGPTRWVIAKSFILHSWLRLVVICCSIWIQHLYVSENVIPTTLIELAI